MPSFLNLGLHSRDGGVDDLVLFFLQPTSFSSAAVHDIADPPQSIRFFPGDGRSLLRRALAMPIERKRRRL